jgi:Leucine-rich repeat (LRR) protein
VILLPLLITAYHENPTQLRDTQFGDFDFNVDLWTFFLDEKGIINSTSFSLQMDLSECVKAFYSSDIKILEYLPINLSKIFPNLIYYEAQNCSIKFLIKRHLKSLFKLQVLNLSGNKLSEIPSKAFEDLQNLRKLNLSRNLLHKIDALWSAVRLTTLDMSHNRFTDIRTKTFENLHELRNLSLSDNRISFLSDEHFRNTKNLEFIWMANNDVKHFSYSMFNFMPNVKFIDFSFNSILNNFIYEKH